MTAPVPQPGPQQSPSLSPQPGAQVMPRPGPPPAAPASPVAAAVARLENVRDLPLHEQPDVYQVVHTELQNALAAIDHA